MIRITAKKDGFRRAGHVHVGTREYPDSTFTPEQLAALKAEPKLIVDVLPDPPKSAKPDAKEKAETEKAETV